MISTTVTQPYAERPTPVGKLLRQWRERRRLTQLDLALRAEVSARHLSFIETGRSRPTSEMILRLAQHLGVPLRERNMLLLSGGYAPAYPANGLGDPPMSAVHEAIEHVLRAHQPFPAVVIDARWELVAGNDAVPVLTEGAAPALLEPPVNVLRLSLHPDGMASRIVNLPEWRAHLLGRLDRDIESAADPALIAMRDELAAYPSPRPASPPDSQAILVPLRLRVHGTVLSLFSTTTVFGTPRDITLSELAIESFYPADAPTAAFLRAAQPSPTTSADLLVRAAKRP
ncbi:MAG TPA: helix-turn-helix transcriptional regulator, partial [Streptosporangiaceae bacterium]|nr:helix-turn-helix transcriptional regulator [Streptosporangiaceae bacterium]